ncbi:MAG: hypothetical protein K8S62_00840 [Candidatus Sabulitectum sp.]|nr:hypothetical protein [Candidatus Sabulitectum sp.]
MVYAGGSTFWSCGYKYSSPNYRAVVSQSIDGGQNWTRHELYSGSQYGYIRAVAVDPSDSDNVFALGYINGSYTLFKTENGGSSWSEVSPSGYSGTPYDLVVHPANPDRLAAASSSGLYTTTNGGLNWSKVTSSFSTSNDLYQSEDLYGLVISTTSGIWLWENWSGSPVHWGDNPGTVSINCAVACADDQTMYAGTAGGAVWTSHYGLSTEEDTHFEVLPAQVSVFPNPVTGGFAALRINLPVSGHTTVTVYSLSGRVLQTVSSEIMTAGSHELRPGDLLHKSSE